MNHGDSPAKWRCRLIQFYTRLPALFKLIFWSKDSECPVISVMWKLGGFTGPGGDKIEVCENNSRVREFVPRGATFLHVPNYRPANTDVAAEDEWAAERWAAGLPVTCDFCFQIMHPGG